MSAAISVDALRGRFEADEAASAGQPTGYTEAGLERALRAIGWGGGDVTDAGAVAERLVPIIDACVHGHRDMTRVYRDIADLLRRNGPRLDGSSSPASAYLPAAVDVVRHYVAGAPRASGEHAG